MPTSRSTYASSYYERQSPAQEQVTLRYAVVRDGEQILTIVGASICAFILGMVVVASIAGVL